MALKQKGAELKADIKKRKRVGFSSIDTGIEANECIKIFLVSTVDEVGTKGGFCVDPIDLNHFFGEDGKIYGYKDLKINIWLSCVSFHTYADITFGSTSSGGNGITDLKPALQKIFGEHLLEKEEFLQTFSTQHHHIRDIVSNGTAVLCDSARNNDNAPDSHLGTKKYTIEVIRMDLKSMPVGLLYSRLLSLVLLLIEGSSPIDITDPRWEIYLVVKKMQDQSGDYTVHLLGFTTVYHFYHYPDSTRLRISQILVLPPYQGQGHGHRLLQSVNLAAESENIYDVTVEEPTEYLQYLRACIDTIRLLPFEPTKQAVDSVISHLKDGNPSKKTFKPPKSVIEIARQKFKINKKQFLRCWQILIYLKLETGNDKCMANFRAYISDLLKGDILDKDSNTDGKKVLIDVPNDYGHDMAFVVVRSHSTGESDGLEEDGATREQQFNQLVDHEMEDISQIAQKVLLLLRDSQ